MAWTSVRNAVNTQRLLWGLLFLYVSARILQLYSGVVPTLALVILHVIPPALFALVHGSETYRIKTAFVFLGLSAGIGSVFETLSLRTGFPFGHYHFTALMGPGILRLPFLLALAYVGMGYLAWVLALLIAGRAGEPLSGLRLLTQPLLASFLMVAWDISMEPVWSTVDQAWVWEKGGPFFGVPISNFLGWYLTSYVFYQLFALYLRDRSPQPRGPGHWRLPVLFYALSAFGNLLLAIPTTTAVRIDPIVIDGSGRQWRSSDIIGACVATSLLVMLPLALMAWIRLPVALADRLPDSLPGKLREGLVGRFPKRRDAVPQTRGVESAKAKQ
jgi:putative membrane protein